MKKILILCPRFPYPVIGGDKLRIYHICRSLSRDYSLTLVSFCENAYEMGVPAPDDGVFQNIHRILLPKWKSYLNTACALFTGKPLQVSYYSSTAMRRKVNELLPEHDAILAHLVRMANYVPQATQYKILEMTDAISLNYERVRQVTGNSSLRSVIYGIEIERLKRFEQKMVAKFDKTILVSDVDREHLVRRVPASDANKIIVCSNGVDVDSLPYNFRPDGKTIVFIGNMVTLQNLDAAAYFAREIMPLVLEKHPDAVFKIVGKINIADTKRFESLPSVHVTGAVDNISDSVAGASIGVCPMRLGAGIQNKILEYMALGIPAIVSSIGFEGLAAKPDQDLFVADSPEDTASIVARILDNPFDFESMAISARQYVEKQHSWAVKLQPLLADLAS